MGAAATPGPGTAAPAPALPGDKGKSLAALRGLQSPSLWGTRLGRGHSLSDPGCSLVFNMGTSSGLSSAPSRTIPCPGWDRDTGVCLSPVPQRAPGALELVVGWCRAAPSTLLGSSWAPRLCWDHWDALAGHGARGSALLLAAPAAACSSGILLKWQCRGGAALVAEGRRNLSSGKGSCTVLQRGEPGDLAKRLRVPLGCGSGFLWFCGQRVPRVWQRPAQDRTEQGTAPGPASRRI